MQHSRELTLKCHDILGSRIEVKIDTHSSINPQERLIIFIDLIWSKTVLLCMT